MRSSIVWRLDCRYIWSQSQTAPVRCLFFWQLVFVAEYDLCWGSGNEFCERLAFYGLATNLVIYLQTVMGADPASAATNLMVFEGTCYLTPLLGAWLADSLWGRYKTILVFSLIYMIVSGPLHWLSLLHMQTGHQHL